MTQTDEEKAREIAEKHLAGKQVWSGGHPYTRQFGEVFACVLAREITAARAEGRRQGMEEAAGIAISRGPLNRWCRDIADSIEAKAKDA